jgi:putative spermidine/putrescine transport system permease protein
MSSSPLEVSQPKTTTQTRGVGLRQPEAASQLSTSRSATRRRAGERSYTPFLLIGPHALVLAVFLILPIALIVTVSFWQLDGYRMVPAFSLDNYAEILGQAAYRTAYLNTFKFCAIVWVVTLAIAFPVAYFLAFHVHSTLWRMGAFLVCTVPFLTSNVIRSISWIPFLGRNGILNSALLSTGLTDQPLDVFLYSDVSVVLAMVHLYTLFMLVPIFNTMLRIDHTLIEAARDGGASEWRVVREVIVPLSAPGITIGTVFVVSLVFGDFMTVRLMSGGQASSVGVTIQNMITSLQYPLAAANSVILLGVTLAVVGILLRLVDIRKEL